MAFILADRVKETATTTGTGDFTLLGAVSGFQAFDTPLNTSDTTYYSIVHQSATEWEVGVGTFTATSTLARTTVLASSNAGAAVNFSAGTKDVFIGLPAGRQNYFVDNATLYSTDAGATAGPILTLYRDSASPATNDELGQINFSGEDSAGNTQVYGRILTTIRDTTTTAEHGYLRLQGVKAGTITDFISFRADLNLALMGLPLNLATPTTTEPPLHFESATPMTTSTAGAVEYDGNCFYGSADTANRGVIPCINYAATPVGNFTLANSAAEQAIFTAANDTLTLETGLYHFDMLVHVSGMSATSGNAAIDILGAGTATLDRLHRHYGQDAALATVAAGSGSSNTAQTAASLVTAATGTVLTFMMTGSFRVTVAGTIIPSITLVTAAAATVNNNTYFRCWRMGSSTAEAVGQWT